MATTIHTQFFYNDALNLNASRVEHLGKLGFDLTNKSILETGCGGIGDITQKLLTYTDKVTLNDAREDNIKNLMKQIDRELEYNTSDLNEECPGEFDVIFSVGTLYHLHKPSDALKYMAEATKEMLILSTCTNGQDYGIDFPDEEKSSQNQSFTGVGCRPGRVWVKTELEKHFKYVYSLKSLPNNSDFIRDRRPERLPGLARIMMVGSHIELDNPNLTTELPLIYDSI